MAEEGGISSPDSSLDGSDGSYEAKRGAGSLLDQLGDTRAVEEYVGQYQIGKIIGKGGFGTVHKGRNLNTGEIVAVKCFRAEKIAKENMSVVMGEAELLMRLHHPNIVKFYGYVKTRHFLYFVLEYLEEGSLSKVLSDFGIIPEKLAAFYIDQILRGLSYLHARRVIHRDIKGSNLLIAKTGEVKLADFGVSAQLNESEKRFSVVGTPYWMAPEVIEMSGHYTESDIWSVGCVVLELVTGQPPYYNQPAMAAMFRIVADSHPPLPPNISPDLADFLLQCWRKDPLERPTAKQLLEHPWLRIAHQSDVQAGGTSLETARSWIEDYNKDKEAGSGRGRRSESEDGTTDDESPVSTMYIKSTIINKSNKASESEDDGGGEESEDDGSKNNSVRITKLVDPPPLTPRTASKHASEKERKEREKREKKERKEREKMEKKKAKQGKGGSLIVRGNEAQQGGHDQGAATGLGSKKSRSRSLDPIAPPLAALDAGTSAASRNGSALASSEAAKKLWLRLDEEMKRSVQVKKEMEAMKLEMEQMRADKNDLRVKLAETRTKNEEIATLAKATLDPDLSNDKREKMRRRLATLLKENERSGSLTSVEEADAMLLRSPKSSKKALRVGVATRLIGAERKKRAPKGSWLRMGNNGADPAGGGSGGDSPEQPPASGSFDLTTSPSRAPDTAARDSLRRSG